MIPLQLSLSGFLSYRDPVILDFTSFELACISGSNGAGKSSLLDAITWALFGQARKRDDSVINAQSNAAEVSLTFAYEGNIYRVQRAKPRDKTALLEFHILQNKDPQSSILNQQSGISNQRSAITLFGSLSPRGRCARPKVASSKPCAWTTIPL
jgi:exonuclease SbcC